VGDLVRGAAGPLHLDRGVRRLPARRGRPGATHARLHPARGGNPTEPAVHEVLHGPARPVALAEDGAHPARARPSAARLAVLDLRLLLLGAADLRRALGRPVAASGAARRPRSGRDRRDPGRDAAAGAAEPSPPARGPGRRALDSGAAGGGRLLGRDPASVGVGDHRARRARARARRSDARQGRRGLARLHGRRRRAAAARGVPVAGLGHRARRARAARLRCFRRPRGCAKPATTCCARR